jgi:hypothetical protein
MANVVVSIYNQNGAGNVEFPNATFEILANGVLRVDSDHTEYFSPSGWHWARLVE